MDAQTLLQKLLSRTGLQQHHAEALRSLEPLMAPLAPEIALAFYDYLGRDPEMHEILWGTPGRVERLYRSFAAWYREIFSGVYDAGYAARRMRIGLVHARVGVRPEHVLPAAGIVQELTLEHFRQALRGSEVFLAIESFEKIMAVEMALMEESYLQALAEGLKLTQEVREAAMVGARVLLEAKG
ncbi:Globin-coupled histidine kinase [Meiothermus luteus]|uniref:Globin-coupled histidine kinase n=1 Tax=Meiothermus luteus TaxID=2026184 RepID=A0A399EWN5_9DEIN|nr:protoglobin domain-containing protein [Meiothermus luteus]RIH87499.1 Globin-coupled histidine kinase [Meiothermus luteus]RMH58718.1 MAG: hypothetical protein D6684_00435 [Deinococcota bacterium]